MPRAAMSVATRMRDAGRRLKAAERLLALRPGYLLPWMAPAAMPSSLEAVRPRWSAPCLVRVKTRRAVTSVAAQQVGAGSARLSAAVDEDDATGRRARRWWRPGSTATLDAGRAGSRRRASAISFGHRRREQQRLALASAGSATMRADVADEAHVEHAVGLVEHEDLDRGRGDGALRPMWSSRRPGVATRTSTPPASARTWRPIGDAAEDDGDAQPQVAGRRLRKLSAIWLASSRVGREHQGAAAAGWRRRRAGRGEALQDRQREGGGLAGAGLRDAHARRGPASTSGIAWAWIGVGVV
jgi:hypothetical protein